MKRNKETTIKQMILPQMIPLALAVILAAVLLLLRLGTDGWMTTRGEEERIHTMKGLLPGSETFVEEEYDGDDGRIAAVYRGQRGYVVETEDEGYAGPIRMWIGVTDGGVVTGLTVRNLRETWGLGRSAADNEEFLDQFVGTSGEAVIGTAADGLTGATVTSRAVARSVSAAVAFVTGADVMSAPTSWG